MKLLEPHSVGGQWRLLNVKTWICILESKFMLLRLDMTFTKFPMSQLCYHKMPIVQSDVKYFP